MSDKFIRAEDVAKELDISKAYAYKMIQQMNKELREKGYLTIAGRINRQYFAERFYGIKSTETVHYERRNHNVGIQERKQQHMVCHGSLHRLER